ncbi:hypothetical protein G7Y89_g7517 [Cudoniella acicularis]|uniref:Protein kinase domain-containing protein n=1 Tax=Cudoniella acicularis TaxID=354080 RepID=A0A8H4RLW9_9HELO|nr:hypothetical protein G7Y89_g7517 [Cudoniella acicularis]
MENPHSLARTCGIDSRLPSTDTADDILQDRNESDSGNTCGQGHTNSTLQSYPAESPGNKRPIPPCLASYAPSNLDRAKVDELRQVLDVDQQMHGTGEELADSLVVTEESKVSENRRTVVNRVKVRGLWLAKKIYKNSDREQVEREIYLQEVEILKLLIRKPHWHVILLLHHYEDPRGRGCLILSPLAQTTLEAFLSQHPNQERKVLVGPWISCLASGLAHIHAQRVKHKDIKPSNILIHGTNPVIADMGISHGFDIDSKSSGLSAGSVAYIAPEVFKEQVRGRRQDVWSMLCCYMEILAFLKDMDRGTFRKSIGPIYFCGYDFVVGWLNTLKPGAVDEEELAFVQLLLDSFKRDPEERPYALHLAKQIQAICKQRPYKYIGECCVLDDTVNISSNLEHAVAGTASILPNPEDLEQGSLLHFFASTPLSFSKRDFPEAYLSLNTLYRQVSSRAICSIRSAERKFLLTIVPKYSKDGKTYLSLSNGFIESLSQAIESGAYISCLYDIPLGEHNDPYTTKYFEILVGEISNRYMTYHWD